MAIEAYQPEQADKNALSPWRVVGNITDKVASVAFSGTPLWWWIGFLISGTLLLVFMFTLYSVATRGVGLWGIKVPVVWGMAIVNLVFWIGIGHAGTFISAFLLLMRQQWRSTFSRFAEAGTLFALLTAGVFPLFHLGRVEYFYWLVPYPNSMILNPQYRSPLVWDLFAISTYAIVSLVFWYIDLIPDIAALRDKAKNGGVKFFYGLLAMGWRGDSAHWAGLHKISYLLAALAAPLVISVHSVIGMDFAASNVAGWHHTIFPPFFVAGAVYSGFAMVMIFAVLLRSGYGMQGLISLDHLEKAAKLMLVVGLVVTYGYIVEAFGAWYKGETEEIQLSLNRAFGHYAPAFWGMIIFNVLVIQLFWFKRIRRNPTWLVIVSLFVLAGMWLERFIIVPVSLSYPYQESMWGLFDLNIWDIITVISPFGLFLTGMFLFIRILPVLPIADTQVTALEEESA